MTEDAYSSSAARADRETSGWAVGFILFAAIMMIMVGCFQAWRTTCPRDESVMSRAVIAAANRAASTCSVKKTGL